MRIAILRPENLIGETAEMFRKEGFDVVAVPFIKIVPTDFEFDPKDYDVLVVTSRTSARIMAERGLRHDNIIAIGKKTAEELRKIGLNPKVPSRFDSRTLYDEFKDYLKDKRVALLRSDKGDPILLNLPNVDEIVIYRIDYLWGDKQKEFLRNLDVDAIVFSSRMIVRSFFELAKSIGTDVKGVTLIAIGPPTREEIERYGYVALMPDEWTFEGVLKLLKSIKTSGES